MSDTVLEQIKSEIAQLAQVVKDHQQNGDKATLDTKALAEVVQGLVDKQVAAKLAEAEANRPTRRGEIIGLPDRVVIPGHGLVPGFGVPSKGIVESGKFAGYSVDDLLFVNWILSKARAYEPNRVKAPTDELSGIVSKALSATGAGAGDEYVPTGMAAMLWQDMFLQSKVVATIGPMPMPSDPFEIPLGWGTIVWRKGTANQATTVNDPATAKSTLTSTEQVTEFNWSYDLDEDAVIAVLPTLRSEVGRDGAEQMDRFVLNGDSTDAATGNINSDDGNPADDSYYLTVGQDGIRHLYLVDNTAQSADISTTLTDALLRAGIGRLGKYAADVSRLAMAVDAETYVNGMLGLTNVVTVDKFGPSATVLTGQLAAYGGIPIVVSGAILEAEDDGKQSVTAANNDEGQITIYHRDMWKVGFKRQLTIELDRDIRKRQFVMVVSFRIATAARGTRSTATHTAGVHGIVRA
jgi:HK97 family phage major capsid protein